MPDDPKPPTNASTTPDIMPVECDGCGRKRPIIRGYGYCAYCREVHRREAADVQHRSYRESNNPFA